MARHLARVQMEPGGERFDKTSVREKQIGFLVNSASSATPRPSRAT
jgi:hypothetical protein